MPREPAAPGTRMNDRTPVDGLPGTWRMQARTLREYGGETPAVAIESCAAQLEDALRESDEATLTLTDAAIESGYSTDHLGRLVREGKIPNAGRPGAPRIARRHLPRKTCAPNQRLAPQPPRREVSTAQIVQSVIDRGG
ncbi:MAG: hypothetical protein OYK82_12415 [Gammaproteobacteria bacterium]|nr:hypothetical protein [Gammaproteobacteria bacterium]